MPRDIFPQTPVVCERCHKEAFRAEPVLRASLFLLKWAGLPTLVLTMLVFGSRRSHGKGLLLSPDIIPWPEVRTFFQVLGALSAVFFFSLFTVAGWYILLKPIHTYACTSCGHRMRGQANKPLWKRPLLVLFAVGMAVFAIGMMALVWAFKNKHLFV